MSTSPRIVTPGPYRATKLWNEVTRLFRAGMPLKKHRQNLRHHPSCFTAGAAVDWLHQLLRSNSNFGPDVTRQQTVQLLKKFLKNHVIEDVKGRWGTEDLEDNNALYRFPSTSPLKPIPCPAANPATKSVKKRPSLRDREGIFKFRTVKKSEKETQENADPAGPSEVEGHEQETLRRELTAEDERDIWRDITLTHLRRILDMPSLDEVLDRRYVNPQNIIHNMTKVNKHGVVTLDDKTGDLPHWVLSAMKSLANWPKYDSAQPSYPGFERDVFKTVSDYFHSLPQPLLTFQLYELFINVLVFSGYLAAPAPRQPGKRKKAEPPSAPPPAKTSFRSTECLLLSLLRQGACDEAEESPMREVLGGKAPPPPAPPDVGEEGDAGGVLWSPRVDVLRRQRARSCSLETILDDDAPLTRQQLFLSSDSLASRFHSDGSEGDGGGGGGRPADESSIRKRPSGAGPSSTHRWRALRPRSARSCLDIVVETREESANEPRRPSRATSCLDVNHVPRLPSRSSCRRSLSSLSPPPQSEPHGSGGAASSTSSLWTLPAPAVIRRCLSSLDVPPRPASPLRASAFAQAPQVKPQHSLVQPQCERVAIEALQLCTLLLPPASRRKLQLLMRMMSRISQNVDMPRLHPAISTRTLMVHTFSSCVLGSAEECDLDELLATRLVSFLMDHQQTVLAVPDYLLGAIADHVRYLRAVQVPVDGVPPPDPVCVPMPVYAFCRQISGAEFERQKAAASQKAMEELLEMILADQNMSEKERQKKLKQFQKQYPEIYARRFPPSDRENKSKPKIKPPLLSIKKTKAFGIRN